ncbi:MAG: DUF1365 family protein [Candidatus Endobugula sp.]|jgi:DUF1365 family protein
MVDASQVNSNENNHDENQEHTRLSSQYGKKVMHSAIYKGLVRHRRFNPTCHEFYYRVFMLYLDLSELDEVFSGTRLWANEKTRLASFKRADYLGDPSIPLDQAVRSRVEEETGHYPNGAIRLLTNLRYFGYLINPISCYYIFNEDEKLHTIVAEVTNTPWKKRHSYVLSCDPDKPKQSISFNKSLHVSPFNPMDIEYRWRNNTPNKNLLVHMQNWQQESMLFDASLQLKKYEITPSTLRWLILLHPFMTLKTAIAIYWQALRLFIKRTPIYNNPSTNA